MPHMSSINHAHRGDAADVLGSPVGCAHELWHSFMSAFNSAVAESDVKRSEEPVANFCFVAKVDYMKES